MYMCTPRQYEGGQAGDASAAEPFAMLSFQQSFKVKWLN